MYVYMYILLGNEITVISFCIMSIHCCCVLWVEKDPRLHV